jgi:lipopolysaccharide cholinephosphotransferase
MINQLEKIHQIQLEMALEVKRICKKHNIKYIIIAGTLLGAVRHKGFIPWDDDLDIGMVRSEYERFIEICKKELKDGYFLQTWESDSGFASPIAKIRKNGTRFVEKNSSAASLHKGIYIDIFPFDNIPTGRLKQLIQNSSTYILKRMLLIRMNYKVWQDNEFVKSILYKALKVLSSILSVNQIKKILNKNMTAHNNHYSEKVVTFGGSYGYKKESIKKEWLDNLKEIDFENEKLSAPANYIEYLTYFYGDFMTPPPENKRFNRHNIIDISFEEEK